MTVAELIKALQEMPQDAQVVAYYGPVSYLEDAAPYMRWCVRGADTGFGGADIDEVEAEAPGSAQMVIVGPAWHADPSV
jgi:hypothetical protein